MAVTFKVSQFKDRGGSGALKLNSAIICLKKRVDEVPKKMRYFALIIIFFLIVLETTLVSGCHSISQPIPVANSAPSTGVGNSIPFPAPKQSSPRFQIITEGFNLDKSQSGGTHIPFGAVIFHWSNGVTEVDGQDGTLLLLAKDAEAAIPPNPSGREIPATWIYQLPDGAILKVDPNNPNISRDYLGDRLILTIIIESGNY